MSDFFENMNESHGAMDAFGNIAAISQRKNQTTAHPSFSDQFTPLSPATPFLPLSDPFNGALKRLTQKANS